MKILIKFYENKELSSSEIPKRKYVIVDSWYLQVEPQTTERVHVTSFVKLTFNMVIYPRIIYAGMGYVPTVSTEISSV